MKKLMGDEGWGGPCFSLLTPSVCAQLRVTLKRVVSRQPNYICGNFTFETLNLHARESTLEKTVPQGLIRNTEPVRYI